MARRQKDIVSYFPHDANACAGDTLTVLQSRFGNDGYAFWFKLLEKLASTDGHCLDCSNGTKWQLLLAKMGVNELTGVEIMNLLVEMQAVDKELWASKLIWCQNLVDNLAEVYKNRRREVPQKPVITRVYPITTEDNAITTGESTQSKVEYSKVYKYTENPNKELAISSTKVSSPAVAQKIKDTVQKKGLPAENSKEDYPDTTFEEKGCLNTLKAIKGWPFDYAKDLDFIRKLSVDFPTVDIRAETINWTTWLLDHPLKASGSPRLRLRNWVQKARKFTLESPKVGGSSLSNLPYKPGTPWRAR